MFIVASNIAVESLTEQHDLSCWDF